MGSTRCASAGTISRSRRCCNPASRSPWTRRAGPTRTSSNAGRPAATGLCRGCRPRRARCAGRSARSSCCRGCRSCLRAAVVREASRRARTRARYELTPPQHVVTVVVQVPEQVRFRVANQRPQRAVPVDVGRPARHERRARLRARRVARVALLEPHAIRRQPVEVRRRGLVVRRLGAHLVGVEPHEARLARLNHRRCKHPRGELDPVTTRHLAGVESAPNLEPNLAKASLGQSPFQQTLKSGYSPGARGNLSFY